MEFQKTARRALGRYPLPLLAKWIAQRAFRGLTAWGRTLPDFIIIGAQRCGTTSLYNYLLDHPGVASAFLKETHFFDIHFAKGLSWYRAHFPFASGQRRLVGEATPYYLFYPHAPRRVRDTVPGAKLIVLLRNPTDRAYSHYYHEVNTGFEIASFEDALDREASILPGETARVAADEGYRSFAHFHYSYLARGIYVDQIAPWIRLFDRERLLFVRSEDFYADPATVVGQVFRFLNLPPWTSGAYAKYNLAHYSDMNPATRDRLQAFFRPHNQRLYEVLGMDLGWDG